jgi:hypothetical protein
MTKIAHFFAPPALAATTTATTTTGGKRGETEKGPEVPTHQGRN